MPDQQKNSKQYTAEDIKDYFGGKLSARDMHALEEAALEDPFLSDAMEGIENTLRKSGSAVLEQDLHELHTAFVERIGRHHRRKNFFSWIGWQAAAAIMAIIGIGLLFYLFYFNSGKTAAAKPAIVQTKGSAAPPAHALVPSSSAARKDLAMTKRPNHAPSRGVAKNVPGRRHSPDLARSKQPPNHLSDTSGQIADRVQNGQQALRSDKGFFANSNEKNINVVHDSMPLAAAQQNVFTGKVLDMNNNPVIGASVTLSDARKGMVTDNNGLFSFRASNRDSTATVTVASVGFEIKHATLLSNNDIDDNIITLKSNRSALSEVVVTGRGSKKNAEDILVPSGETLRNAEPVAGWKKYRDYLEKNRHRLSDSVGLNITEVISFTVRQNGMLGNFKIIESYSDEFDAEAIRLVKQGPAWKTLKSRKTVATLTIRF